MFVYNIRHKIGISSSLQNRMIIDGYNGSAENADAGCS